MSYETFPDINPDRSSKRKKSNRTLRADFGDGYNQTGLDGINTVMEEWSLSFANYPFEEVNTIRDFLDARQSVESFYWQAPGDASPKLWRQEGDYDESFPGSMTKTITFTIKRVYV